MPLRIGLIGAGANTRTQHIPGFRRCADVEILGVANRSVASGRRIADEFGIPKVYASVEELCASPDIDAVSIGTWPYKHREYTIMALEAGKHVLCEARMAMDLSEAEDMLEASERNPGLVAQLVPAPFDFRLGPTITRLIDEGALGDIREVTVNVLNASALDPAIPLHWRQRADYSGKNVMMFGIFVEVMHRWLGDHAEVLASGDTFINERTDAEAGTMMPVTVPDTYIVTGHLKRGARITYHFSSVAAGADTNGVTVFGTKATLRWKMGDTAVLQPHGGGAKPLEPDPGTDRGWKVEEDFVASVREGAPIRLTNFVDGVRYMRVIDAAHTSCTSGRAVTV
ncbi:MAG: Gfo/Idh/MocA family protein [Dehalococcoidia bacterium]